MSSTEAASPSYTLWQLVLYALKLGSIGFGGPVALVGYMHRDLVERRQPAAPELTSMKAMPTEAPRNFSRMGRVLPARFGQALRNSIRMVRWFDV